MPNYGQAVGNAAQGAAIGTSILPGIGTAIGGGLGFLSGLFSPSGEDQYNQRQDDLLSHIYNLYQQSMATNAGYINQQTRTGINAAQEGGMRQAISQGRGGNASAYINPNVSNIANQGSQRYQDMLRQLTDWYNQQQVGVREGFAGRPFEPTAGDMFSQYAGPIGKLLFPGSSPSAGMGQSSGYRFGGNWGMPSSGSGQYGNLINSPLNFGHP